MFANLKNKLIEEVKASPSKFQQFANAAQAAVSSSSSTQSNTETVSGNENFFSITEEDTPQNSPHKPLKLPAGAARPKGPNISPQQANNGAIPRTRKLSNSSIASDVSFRLPAYESPAAYHLHSDLDVSASEVEDSASSVRLDPINKEQLYDAYKKALDRYQKYRSRYADLAKKYKDLERDSTKARSVLVETQEKAIRRISELREQCTLEQQAKAHLEEALRMEMDDMQCKMQAYQTKLTLLGENPENIIALTRSEPLLQLNGNLNTPTTSTTEISNLINLDVEGNHMEAENKVKALEQELSERQIQLEELNRKLQEATDTIDLLRKQEEESAISLAQTKQAIYSELESKETQVKRLKTNLNEVEVKYQQTSKENIQLAQQVAELQELKDKVKIITLAKQEAEAKNISSTHVQNEMKQQLAANAKIISELEERVQNLSIEQDERLKGVQLQNEQLHETIRQNQNSEIAQNQKSEMALAEIDNELNRTKTENNGLRQTIEENHRQLEDLQSEIDKSNQKLEEMQKENENANRLREESEKKFDDLLEKLDQVHKEKKENEIRVKQLEAEIKTIQEQGASSEAATIVSLKEALFKAAEETNRQMKEVKEVLANKEKVLKSSNTKLNKLKKQIETQGANSDEVERLRNSISEYEANLAQLQESHQVKEDNTEKDKEELKAQLASILQEIKTMEEEMRVVRASHAELESEKRSLEQKIENMTKENQEANTGTQQWRDELSQSQEQLKLIEQKLQIVESENSQLAEKNCLLEENSNRLGKLIADRVRQQNQAELELTQMKQQLETAEGNIQKLNEKMTQVLDENSRLHNAKEIMEHEFRSLQDQCESREKEKLCVLDSNKCLEDEMKVIKEEIESLTRENNNLSEMLNNLRGDLSDALEKVHSEDEKNRKLSEDLKKLSTAKEQLEEEWKAAKEENNRLKSDTTMSGALAENIQLVEDLRQKLTETESSYHAKLKATEDLISELNLKLEESTNDSDTLQKSNEELSILRENIRQLQQQLQEAAIQIQEAEAKHQQDLNEKISASELQVSSLSTELNAARENIIKLTESNESLQTEINTIENSNQSRLAELESRLQQTRSENQNLQETARNATDLEKKLQNYEQLQLENEYLNTLIQQLQADIRKQSEDRANVAMHVEVLKEKINSQQCELYVLNENQEKHSAEVDAKCHEILKSQEEVEQLKDILEQNRLELTQQTDHAKFITEQNDNIQKELLACQHQLAEVEKELRDVKLSCEEVTGEKLKLIEQLTNAEALNKQQIGSLRDELERSGSTVETLNREVNDLNKEIEKVDVLKEEKNELLKEIEAFKVELAERVPPAKIESAAESAKATQQESDNLRNINKQLQKELEDLQYKSRAEIANLTEEIDDLLANAKHMSEKVMQYERQSASLSAAPDVQQEKDELESKLKTIMHDVQDVSNRNLFLEQKCENYLILEQSNERLKSQNEKLSRQLDETLVSNVAANPFVSMQHNEGMTANTEFEYLKNIMFQYLTGTMNGNNETLVKVISAVLKFTPQQTQVALEKEHQRRSLLGQLNKLL